MTGIAGIPWGVWQNHARMGYDLPPHGIGGCNKNLVSCAQ